ncbi:MAG: hypothetical protein JWN70_1949 [Planctomycetaceae bacterium]|nr:hypothetical protein [Planctomycetaceae bacterium]
MQAQVFDFPESARQLEDFQRRLAWMLPWILFIAFASIGLFLFAGWYFELSRDPPGELTVKRAVVFLMFPVVTLVAIWAMSVCFPNPPKLNCPHCQVNLAEGNRWLTAHATGYCPKCLQPLFETDGVSIGAPENHIPGLLTRAEFQFQRSAIKHKPPQIAFLIGVPVIAVSYAIVLTLEKQGPQPDGEVLVPLYSIITAVACSALTIWYMVVQSRARTSELKRCRCEKCQEAIGEGQLPLITGHCTTCGAQVLADPLPRPPWPVWERPISLAWYRIHGKFWDRWAWLHCLVGSAPAIVWIVVICWLNPESRTEPAPVTPFWLFLLLLSSVLQISGIAISGWWMRRCWSPKCPQCQHTLADVSQIVMASRNCPFCATTILGD